MVFFPSSSKVPKRNPQPPTQFQASRLVDRPHSAPCLSIFSCLVLFRSGGRIRNGPPARTWQPASTETLPLGSAGASHKTLPWTMQADCPNSYVRISHTLHGKTEGGLRRGQGAGTIELCRSSGVLWHLQGAFYRIEVLNLLPACRQTSQPACFVQAYFQSATALHL